VASVIKLFTLVNDTLQQYKLLHLPARLGANLQSGARLKHLVCKYLTRIMRNTLAYRAKTSFTIVKKVYISGVSREHLGLVL